MRLMQRMDALEARMIEAIGQQQRQHESTNKLSDPEDSDSPDAKRYTTMLGEAFKAMDRQLEEICKMEKENKGGKVDNQKVNMREGAANISQDEHGSKDGKFSHKHRYLEEVGAKRGWSDHDDESDEV